MTNDPAAPSTSEFQEIADYLNAAMAKGYIIQGDPVTAEEVEVVEGARAAGYNYSIDQLRENRGRGRDAALRQANKADRVGAGEDAAMWRELASEL